MKQRYIFLIIKKSNAEISLCRKDPVWHYEFIENGKFGGGYNINTNSFGFKDSKVRYMENENNGQRILIVGDFF